MADILFLDPVNGNGTNLEFEDLVTLVKGSSIRSLAISEGFIELGLTDALNVRFQARGGVDVLMFSTLNKKDRPPVRLRIIESDEIPSAALVEARIRTLRQLYATAALTKAGREGDIGRALQKDPNADLELLLKPRNRLYLTAASEGSFWVTVVTKSATAFKSLSQIVPLFYDEGRHALLQRVKATTELKKLDVRQKEVDIAFDQATKLVSLVEKVEAIKDPALREKVRESIFTNITALDGGSPLLLPPPDKK